MAQQYTVQFDDCGTFTVPTNITNVTNITNTYFYDGGLIVPTFSSFFNKDTKTWRDLGSYLNTIKNAETGSTSGKLLNQINTGSTESDINMINIDAQTRNDTQLIQRLKAEYCYYRVRYNAYLVEFLNAIKPNASATQQMQTDLLEILIDLNVKINAFTILLDEYTKTRAAFVDARNTALNVLNESIRTSVQASSPTAALLGSGNAILNTRKEMIRYTKEKNNSITNQISLWAALNIVAIGMIFHLYRTL